MTAQEFQDRAIEWLRGEHQLRTAVVAGVRLDGVQRVRGFFARGTGASRWGLIGLWIVTFGVIVGMANLPGFDAGARAMTQKAGYAVVGLGCACWVWAEITRRREREAAIIDLRALTAEPPTPDTIASLHDDARGAIAWLLSEGELDDKTLAAASKRGVRCFVLDGARFKEATQSPA